MHLFILEIQSILKTILATPILDHAQPKDFRSTSNFCEFVSIWKKLGYFIGLFWRNSWFKNPVIWLAESILAHVLLVKDMCRNTTNNINFHYKMNSVKIDLNSIFFKKFLNCKDLIFGLFLAHFPSFGVKKVFSKLSHTTSERSLSPCQHSEKSNDPIPTKHPHRQQDRRIDRPYFIGSFWLLLGV